MEAEELRRLAKFDTFRPIRVYLKDGRTFDLVEPGFFYVLRTIVILGVPKQIWPYPIWAERAEVPIEQVDRVEFLAKEDHSVAG